MIATENQLKTITIVCENIPAEIIEHAESQGIKIEAVKTGKARKNLVEKFKSLLLDDETISPEQISKLEQEPDLIIKVGKKSLEDSMIIGANYAEIYFVPNELNLAEFEKAIQDFKERKRNFGK